MVEKSVGFKHFDPTVRMLIALLTLVGLIVPPVLGFVNFDKRIDIVETDLQDHEERELKQWDKVLADVENNEDAIHALQLVDKGLTIQYTEILRRIDETNEKLDNLVRAE